MFAGNVAALPTVDLDYQKSVYSFDNDNLNDSNTNTSCNNVNAGLFKLFAPISVLIRIKAILPVR